eukprot:scaffold83549_cov34-Phaeocystis_antarctica.AAC.1
MGSRHGMRRGAAPGWSNAVRLAALVRRLGCGCGRRLVMGSCVIRETTRRVVRGLGRAFLFLSIYLSRRLVRVVAEAVEGRSVGRPLPWERLANQSCQARPEVAQGPTSGTA